MIRHLAMLVVVGGLVWLLLRAQAEGAPTGAAQVTFMLGFALLAACLVGETVGQLKLPHITGYIAAGILFGPHVLKFLDGPTQEQLGLFKDMAYAFIGLAAGAELRLAVLRGRAKSIALIILCTTTVVMVGVGTIFFFCAPLVTALKSFGPAGKLAVAGMVGVIAAARSPASAIAIISETKAKGPFAETILGVSVAMDVIIICLFSLGAALCELAVGAEHAFDIGFVLTLTGEILVSLILGVILGAGLALYCRNKGPHLPLVLVGVCFVVYKCSKGLEYYLEQVHDTSVHLEPLLICAAAGFTIQNLSRQGERLLQAMDRIGLPVYVIFFTLAGAALNIEALKLFWAIALALALARVSMIFLGVRLATVLAGDPPVFRRYCWMGFVTQAGMSLALASQIENSFPTWGVEVTTILVAVITINQVVGPIAFKYSLEKAGEVKKRGRTSRVCSAPHEESQP